MYGASVINLATGYLTDTRCAWWWPELHRLGDRVLSLGFGASSALLVAFSLLWGVIATAASWGRMACCFW
jgi:hypothetical protein